MIEDPGPKWTVGVSHDTVAALDATDGNHEIAYVGVTYESQ